MSDALRVIEVGTTQDDYGGSVPADNVVAFGRCRVTAHLGRETVLSDAVRTRVSAWVRVPVSLSEHLSPERYLEVGGSAVGEGRRFSIEYVEPRSEAISAHLTVAVSDVH